MVGRGRPSTVLLGRVPYLSRGLVGHGDENGVRVRQEFYRRPSALVMGQLFLATGRLFSTDLVCYGP